MIRTILVPLAGDGAGTVDALEAAGGIARGFGAHLVCLHVRTDGTAYVAALGGGMLASIPAEELAGMIDRDGDRRCQAARRQFDDFCGRRNIPVTSRAGAARDGLSAELLFDYGDPADALAGAGRVSDLIVMRRPDDTGLPHGMLHAALFETGRPLLLAGPQPTVTYDRIAIGWTPGREAARAVAAAAPLIERAKAIEVICVDADAGRRQDAMRLVDSLRWRGLPAAIRLVVGDGDGDGPALLDAVRGSGSDLLVMGGFGHNRFRQFVLGGVSRHVLQHGDCAVLMAH